MQFEITDRAAIVFASEFYAALADGYPADSAVAEARKAIFADANDIEWGTPVLFMRVPDGRIFDVTARASAVEIAEEEPEVPQPTEPEPVAEPLATDEALEEAQSAEAEPEPLAADEALEEPQSAEAEPEPLAADEALEEPQSAEPEPVAEPLAADEALEEPQPAEPEPVAEPSVVVVSAPAPTPPEPREVPAPAPAAPAALPARQSRALLVILLALGGAGIGLVANALSHLEGEPAIGTLAILAPETIGVPVLTAAVAILFAAGRIREQIAYGLLLGFGILTVAEAIGLALVPAQVDAKLGGAPVVLLAGGALVLTAAIVGILGEARAHATLDARFHWVPASLLAAAGAAVGLLALFIPFGRLALDGTDASVLSYGSYGLTWLALEPVVAIAAAIAVAYALGRGSARRLLAAGAALALGAQTALYWGTWLGGVMNEEYLKPVLGAGCFVGFAAAALLIAAGVVARRSAEEHGERSDAGAVG